MRAPFACYKLFAFFLVNMKHFGELITRAVRVVGNEQALATKVQVSEETVQRWVSGQVRGEPEDVALIAAAAGLDPVAWFVRASLARHSADSPRGHLIHQALNRVVASDHRGDAFLWSVKR